MSERPTKWKIGEKRVGPIFADEQGPAGPANHRLRESEIYVLDKYCGDGIWKTNDEKGRYDWYVNEAWPSELLAPGHSPQPSETGGDARMGDAPGGHPVACLMCGGDREVMPFVCHPCWRGPRRKEAEAAIDAWNAGRRDFPRRPVEAAKPTEEEGARWQCRASELGTWQSCSVNEYPPNSVICPLPYKRLVSRSGRILRIIPEAPAPREAPVYVGIDWGKGVKAPKCNDRHRAYGLSCLEDRGHAGNHRNGEAEWEGVKRIKLFRAPLSGSPYCMAQGPLCTRPKAEGATMCEEHIAAEMRRRDEDSKPEPGPRPFQQSHVLTAGGVWSMRDEGRR